MILDRAVRRDIEEVLRHEQRDERHHLQVGLERAELLPHLGLLVGLGLIDRQVRRHRGFEQRIRLRAGFGRRDVHRDDILAALQQRFEHRFAERLLAVDHDTHWKCLSRASYWSSTRTRGPITPTLSIGLWLWVPGLATLARDDSHRYAASALAPFSAGVIAPEPLISATSLDE